MWVSAAARSLALVCLLGSAAIASPPNGGYVFSYFLNNGQDGLHLATSTDGYHWQALAAGKSVLTPLVGESKLMRDPCILLGPDGVFRMVWTDSWTGITLGYASSNDLVHWSQQKAVAVMAYEPATLNTWAPEVHYDAVKQQYIIFWASTIPGRFPETQTTGDGKYNHRIYCTTTTDFQTFTLTRLYFDPGYECIDATMLRFGGRFCMIYKDETLKPVKKNLHLAFSNTIDGPFTPDADSFTRSWVEGPTAITVGDEVVVYFDCYRDHHYGAMQSKDLKTWQDITDRISMPPGIRHGTAIPVPADVMARIVTAAQP
jgi:hypothetical protein